MTSKQIGFWTLLFTAAGVIATLAALRQSRDQTTTPQSSTLQTSTVSAPQPDCSALGIQGGNVTVTCDKSVHNAEAPKPFAAFSDDLSTDNIAKFSNFVDLNPGKIVKLSLRFEDDDQFSVDKPNRRYDWQSDGTDPIGTRIIADYHPDCNDKADADCSSGTEYVFVPVKDEQISYRCNGAECVDGYFSVEPQQGLHAGVVSVALVRVPDAQAYTSDPRAR